MGTRIDDEDEAIYCWVLMSGRHGGRRVCLSSGALFDNPPSNELRCFFLELRLPGIWIARFPRAVLASALRVWCNAIPPSLIIGNGTAPCPMCGDASGSDLRHVAACSVLHVVSLEGFRHEARPGR